MPTPRLTFFFIFLFIGHFFAFSCHAEILSWVDDNGVRHFSNSSGPKSGEEAGHANEYRSSQSRERDDSSRNHSNVLKMYEKDKKKYNRKKARANRAREKKLIEESRKASNKKLQERGRKLREDHLKNKEKIEKLDATRRMNEKLQRDYYRGR